MNRFISDRKLVVVLFVTAFTLFVLAQEDMKRSQLPGSPYAEREAAAARALKNGPDPFSAPIASRP